MRPNKLTSVFISLAGVVTATLPLTLGVGVAHAATARFADVQVDVDCGGTACTNSSIADANTARKITVLSDGSIYALFYGDQGIRVAKSTNGGQSFSPSVQVNSANREAEITSSSNGTLFVSWGESSGTGPNSTTQYYVSRSLDKGATWSAPVNIGSRTGFGRATLHTATDGEYFYGIASNGKTLYRSSDNGATFSTTTVTSEQWAYSDVHVDPLNGYVNVVVDEPQVSYFVSTDRGATFGAEKRTEKDVYFSVGALTSSTTSKYLFVAGAAGAAPTANLERINLTTGAVDTFQVSDTQEGGMGGANTRSLSADQFGNVVSGNYDGTNLQFQYSTNNGATFSAAETVVTGASIANAAINTTNGDIMFLYEKNDRVYLTTYSGLLTGYAISLSLTSIDFTAPGETQDIILTNTSTTSQPITSIALSNTLFTFTTTCKGTLAAGAKCKISVTAGTTPGSATLTANLGGFVRAIPVTLGALASQRPPASGDVVITLGETVKTLSFGRLLTDKEFKKQYAVSLTPKTCTTNGSHFLALAPGVCKIRFVSRSSAGKPAMRATKPAITTTVSDTGAETGVTVTRVRTIRFEMWSSLSDARFSSKAVRRFKKAEGVWLVGHTASITGSTKENLKLGRERALMVRKILTDAGVKTGKIFHSSAGATQPLSKTDQARNRRVEIFLIPS